MPEPGKLYSVQYQHNGAWRSLQLHADSMEDCRARLRKLPMARIEGEMVMRIPVATTWHGRLWQRLTAWLRA